MHHIRLVPDSELPAITDDNGKTRAATVAELLNYGLQRIGTDPDTGGGIYSVACVDPCQGHPGVEISTGFLNERHAGIPARLKPHVHRARVFRATDGTNLRQKLRGELGEGVHLREARRRADDEAEPVEHLDVLMKDIRPGDVVERHSIYPMRWAGEVSIR